ncbi:MAG: homoserine dehydrogenase [Methylococcaceae bacterium]|nr:homoserine dehydrogenase [Methylococcaceae bacterium]
MKPVKVGVLGLGTVGGGVVNVLTRNAKEISRRAGRKILVTHASARNLTQERICDTQGIELTTNSLDIINDPEIDIILELIGGTTLAKNLILQAIENGKHIVTANKALIALHGNEIFAKASEKGVMVLFEAAVAGGIPIIKAIREGLSGNQIEWLAGIINGTGNFILTEMRDKGRDFSEVLAEAQVLGYAEADPTFDVEGIDAGHKLAILASLAFGIPLQFEKVFTEGISNISRADVEYAEELGYRIKHLGIARKTEQGIELRVHPTLIPERRLIANVDGVMNAVLVQGDAVGPTLYYGAGAGAEPTASAVISDVVDVVRVLTGDPEHRVPHLAFQEDAISDIPVLTSEQIQTAYYLRLTAEDKPGVLAEVTRILSNHNISIEALIQKEPLEGKTVVPVIMLTQTTLEKEMNAAIIEIEALSTITGSISRIRLETLG